MDSMYSAIKARRGGLLNDSEENAHQMSSDAGGEDAGSGLNMKSLVQALSSDQKSQLLSLLVSGSDNSPQATSQDKMSLEQGGMSPGEEADIQEELGEGHESEDDIAESMLASSDKNRAAGGDKPRNLGERVKFNLATKLKNKGK